MYDCSKIKRITILYSSSGPGKYAGDNRKILGPEESMALCEEANRAEISIEMLLKSREKIESIVINTVIPFPQPEETAADDAGKAEEKKEEEPAAPAGSQQ